MTEDDRVQVCGIAVDLLSEEGENVEYDRAIIEMTATILGIPADQREGVAIVLRALKTGLVPV